MLLVKLEPDDCTHGGALVYIGAVALALARATGEPNLLQAQRKMFARVNAAVQHEKLRPYDPGTHVPLSKSDYGLGVVSIEELRAWGRESSPPYDFQPAGGTATPDAVVSGQTAAPAQIAATPEPDQIEAGKPASDHQAPEATAPAQTAATPEPVVTASETPSQINPPKKRKRDLLTPLIESAQRECNDPLNTAAVWLALERKAIARERPFIGKTEEGLQWVDSSDKPQFLSFKNLRDRINRKPKKPRQDSQKRAKAR